MRHLPLGAGPFIAALFVPALIAAAWASQTSQAPEASQTASPPASSQASAPEPPGLPAEDAAREGQSIKTVCGHCHNLELVLNTPKSYDAWHDTVQKMIDHGAKGTDDQLDDVMDYLERTVTTIDVNSADADELEIVLNVSDATAQAILARRTDKKFTGLADLKTIPGVDAATVDAKARMIFFH
ncbi:MAG TPA: helix-hairpin-helix domain-containing protein [Acidobacteriaceae bacterium]|nr:helix-hairpin-helix domain-containing protein [Acidobacteriaceae bacterium]